MSERLKLVPHGRPALDALFATIVSLKHGDPLAPVTVAPPSTYAALALRRVLGRRVPLVNTRFMPLARVAELLGAPSLAAAGRRPLTAAVHRAAVRATLADEAGVFAPVAGEPATIDALARACSELAPLDDDALGRLARRSRVAAEVVRVAREVGRRTSTAYDPVDATLAAAEAAGAGAAALRDVGTVVLYLPGHLSRPERGLLEALAREDRLAAIVGLTGEAEVDREAAGLAETLEPWLGAPDRLGEPAAPAIGRAVIAPTPEDEVRVVARDLLGHVRGGVPLFRIAVLSATGDPYSLVAADVLAEAEVGVHGPDPRTLAHTVAGRVLLGALALPGLEFARHEVVAWLESGPISGGGAPAGAVDRWSRVAGITTGEHRWLKRLGYLADRLEARAGESAREGDDEAAERRRSDAAEVRAVAGTAQAVFDALRPPGERSWSAYAAWASDVLHRFLGGESAREAWPEHEIEALRAVRDVLGSLAGLDAVEARPALAVFRQALADELAAPAPRRATFGQGVFVGRVADAVGADFDVVYVLGMSEGQFPRPIPPNSLLTEGDREAASEWFPSRQAERRADRATFLAALATAPQRVVTAPRADPRTGRPVHPSPWLADDLRHDTPAAVIPSAEAGLREASDPGSRTELDLRHLLTGATACAGTGLELGPGFEAVAARAAGAPGHWTGFVGGGVTALEPSVSPTALERWSECGYRYFLEHVLRVRDRDDPEELETIAAHERGNLVHAILEDFFAERVGTIPADYSWTDADRARLDELAATRFDEFEQRGLTGRAVLWQLERRRIRRDLAAFLEEDTAARAELGVAPVATELSFRASEGTPVTLTLRDGRTIDVGGRVDRVDAAPDGSRLWVLDYKTGRPIKSAKTVDPFEGDPFAGGTKLQLPVYALAARAEHGVTDDVPVRADYWYVTSRWWFKREGFDVTPEIVDAYHDLIGRITGAIVAGVFPAHPGDDAYDYRRGRFTHEHCLFCPFDAVCPVDRADVWARVELAPESRPYREVVDAGGAGPAEGAEP